VDIPTKIGAEETLKMTVPYFAGARKFAPSHIIRNDLVSLAREASEVSGIP
jgi:hypothetical protein